MADYIQGAIYYILSVYVYRRPSKKLCKDRYRTMKVGGRETAGENQIRSMVGLVREHGGRKTLWAKGRGSSERSKRTSTSVERELVESLLREPVV